MSDARRRRVRSLVCVVLAAGCAGRLEAAARDDLRAAEGALAEREPDQEAGQPAPMDVAAGEGLAGYTRLALAHHPALHAAFARWKASVLRIARARRLPEPTLAFGVFVRSVETRVGPQRARFSLRQSFPWPTRLTAGADAAAAEARALQRRFDATALEVAARVAEAYWELWETRAARALHREHVALFRAVADSLRGRLATGTAMLAELQQVDLAAARMDDVVRGLGEDERAAEATLRAAVGVEFDALPTSGQPPALARPADAHEALEDAALAHPALDSLALGADAAEARAVAAQRLPSFSLGVDWIVTGDAAAEDVQGSGRDAVIVGAGLSVPLWQRSYADEARAAELEAAARRDDRRALAHRVRAALTGTLARLRDARRRAVLHEGTLAPQAEAALDSVLGAFTVGRAAVADVLLAERDLLEIRLGRGAARADHARAWARLEELVARPVAGRAGAEEPEGR